jgi:hypothetical protein
MRLTDPCAFLPLSALLGLSACASALDDLTPYVTTPRVLAITSEPAEAKEGEEVLLRALYADASGVVADAPLDWSFCVGLKPLAELGPVTPDCLVADDPSLVPIDYGPEVTGAVPLEACSLFGPNPPPAQDGESAGRPTDPDVTGGYYQPVVVFDEGEASVASLGAVRLRCGLAGVTQATYIAWNQGYHSNTNPRIATLSIVRDGAVTVVPIEGEGEPTTLAPGEVVGLRVDWPECPLIASCGDGVCSAGEDSLLCAEDCETPVACGGAETYLVYDADSQSLIERRESISASAFVTGGALGIPRAGRAGDDAEVSVELTFTAPEAPGELWLGAVLRDDRGGVGFDGFRLRVDSP